MRAWTAIVVGALLAAGCRGEPRGMGEVEEQRVQQEEERRFAETKRNDPGELTGSGREVPGGPEVATGPGAATGVVVRATEQQVVIRTLAGQELPLMLEDDSRILHGGQEVDVSHLAPGVEVRASWEAEQGTLRLEQLEVMPGH